MQGALRGQADTDDGVDNFIEREIATGELDAGLSGAGNVDAWQSQF